MKKGQIVTGIVERIDYQNKGLVRIDDDGHLLYVANVIPGQKVSVRVQKTGKSGIGKGVLVEVIASSALETAYTPCKLAGVCGGCVYQTLDYAAQLKIKSEQIRRLLSSVIGEDEYDRVFDNIYSSPDITEYRNKMEFSFGDDKKGGQLMLGLHKRGSFYDITDASDCRIINKDMRSIVRATVGFFRAHETPYFHKNTHEGYLRHLLLRRAVATGELLIDLVTVPISGADNMIDEIQPNQSGVTYSTGCAKMADRVQWDGLDEKEEKDLLDGWMNCLIRLESDGHLGGRIAGILHTRCSRISDVIEDGGTDVLYGRDYIVESILGLSFKITPFSFFQTNSRGAEVLYEVAREYLVGKNGIDMIAPDLSTDQSSKSCEIAANTENSYIAGNNLGEKNVYDLYSGTGTIAQIMAPAAMHVTGVEIVTEAVEAARENAKQNGINNCDFIAGDVLKVLYDIPQKPDMIILDPPRDGIHPKVLPKIISYGVDEILYISCKASSLARDLPSFIDAGYRVVRIGIVDMFPSTGHVETVCLLSNTQRPKKESYITLDVEMEDYYRIKNEGKNLGTGE